MRLVKKFVLSTMLTCSAGILLAGQQTPNSDVPSQSPGTHNPDTQQEKSTGKTKNTSKGDSGASSENDIQNGGQPASRNNSTKKTKKPHNPQGHGPQHHDPNGQS